MQVCCDVWCEFGFEMGVDVGVYFVFIKGLVGVVLLFLCGCYLLFECCFGFQVVEILSDCYDCELCVVVLVCD